MEKKLSVRSNFLMLLITLTAVGDLSAFAQNNGKQSLNPVGSGGSSGSINLNGSGGLTGGGGVVQHGNGKGSTVPVNTTVTTGPIVLPSGGTGANLGTITNSGTDTNSNTNVSVTNGTNGTVDVNTNGSPKTITGTDTNLHTTTQVGGVVTSSPGNVGKVGSGFLGPFGFINDVLSHLPTGMFRSTSTVTSTSTATSPGTGTKTDSNSVANVGSPLVGSGRPENGAGSKVDSTAASVGAGTNANTNVNATPQGVPDNICEDNAIKEINALVLKDKNNILPMMFELTAMKLAKRALEQNPKATTFEELTRGNIDLINKQMSKANDPSIQKEALRIYQSYGKNADLLMIQKDFHDLKKRSNDACYFDQEKRFTNTESAAYVLSVSMAEPQSGITEADAAAIWMAESLRKKGEAKDYRNYRIGGELGNLLNISTRVTRYLGRILQAKNATAADIAKEITDQEAKLKKVFKDASDKVEASLRACYASNCANCSVDDRVKSFKEKNVEDLQVMQKGLLSNVNQADNLELEKGLKAKLNGVTFDFSNFAREGSTPMVPSRLPRQKYDACRYKKKK